MRLLQRVSNSPLPIASWYSFNVKPGQRSESVSVSSTQRGAGPVFNPPRCSHLPDRISSASSQPANRNCGFSGWGISWRTSKSTQPYQQGASVDHGVDVETTEEHVNRAADRGCCVSSCSLLIIDTASTTGNIDSGRIAVPVPPANPIASIHLICDLPS